MKKIRAILTSVAVLTIVGSALAFTGKFNTDYCFVAKPIGGCSTSLQCQSAQLNGLIDATNHNFCYTLKIEDDCKQQTCPTEGKPVAE